MPERELRTGNVLLIDVIRYSPRTDDQQSQIIEILNRIVGETTTMVNTSEEDRLCLPTGDGLAAAFFRDPRSSVYLALELDGQLNAYNSQVTEEQRFGIRMGINQGLVYVIKDINQQNNLAGDGINRGQRVMDCGDTGHILISQDFADSLARADSRLAKLFHPLGEFEVKHGEKITIANIYDAEHGNPEMPTRKPRVGGTLYDAAPALCIMLVISRPLVGYYREDSQGQPTLINPSPISSDVSIQLLPPPENCMETEALFRALQKSEAPVEVSVLHGTTPGGLVETLTGRNIRVLHFDGHCSRRGSLVLENPYGEAHLVGPDLLARIASERGIGLVSLRTSYAVECVEALRNAGVPAVIGMTDTIGQDFAVAFISGFYREVAKGRSLREAFERGRLMVKLLFGTDSGSEDSILLSAEDENTLLAQLSHQGCPPIFNSYFTEPATVPRADIPFIGRERVMVKLIQELTNGGVVELYGESGIGKTALARVVARWYVERGRFPGGVFWVDLSNTRSVESVWDDLGSEITGNGFRLLISEEKASFLTRYLRENPSLIVLDDFDTISRNNQLRRWLPANIQPPSACLEIAEEETGIKKALQLQELTTSEARALFVEHARQKGWDIPIDEAEEGIIDDICHLVGHIPLAIILIASKAAVFVLQTLKKEIEQSIKTVTMPDNALLPERYQIIDACLDLSYRLLSLEEARLLLRRLMILMDNADDELIKVVCGVTSWRSAIAELIRSSLLYKEDDSYRFHALVRQYGTAQLKVHGEEYMYLQRAEDTQRRYLKTRKIKVELGDRSKTAISLARLASLYEERGDLSTTVRLLAVAHDIFAAIGSANTTRVRHDLEAFRGVLGNDHFDHLLKTARSHPDKVVRQVLNQSRP